MSAQSDSHPDPQRYYLAGLDLRGRKAVVVGGGSVAQRRVPNLVSAGADVHVVAIDPTPAVESFPGITVHRRAYADGDLDGAWYAMACTDDPTVNAAVVAEAERRHTFCVRADDARFGSAVTPASGRHRDVQFGVLAGGDHRLSAALRAAIGTALADGSLQLDDTPQPPGVALVGGGPGDPDLITVRGLRLLMAADVVVADRLAPPELLAALGPQVEIIDAAKVPYGRAMKQEAINQVLVDKARDGNFVVRFKGGESTDAATRRSRRAWPRASRSPWCRGSAARSGCPRWPVSRSPTAVSRTTW